MTTWLVLNKRLIIIILQLIWNTLSACIIGHITIIIFLVNCPHNAHCSNCAIYLCLCLITKLISKIEFINSNFIASRCDKIVDKEQVAWDNGIQTRLSDLLKLR